MYDTMTVISKNVPGSRYVRVFSLEFPGGHPEAKCDVACSVDHNVDHTSVV